MKILIDLDNTLINTPLIITKIFNYYNPERALKYRKDIKWNFENILKNTNITLKELFAMFDKEDFYDFVEFTPNAKVINDLSWDNEIIICSKHKESRKPITQRFINKYFPNCKLIFVDNFEDKCNIEADIIVDDRLECLQGKQRYKICYGNYDWNKKWDGKRINNMIELVYLVNEINNKNSIDNI